MNSHKKKVCFIINKPIIGGAELFLLKLIRSISGEIDCHLIFLNAEGPLFNEFSGSDCVIHKLNFSKHPYKLLISSYALYRKIREIKPEIVHTWLYISDLIGGIASYMAGRHKIIWSIRQTNISYSQNNLHTYILIRICGFFSRYIPAKIISCSKIAADNHVRNGLYSSSKIVTIPNGYDTEIYKFSSQKRLTFRDRLGLVNDENKLVAFIGRYDIQKGVDNFIEIAKKISLEMEAVRFVLIGAGCHPDNTELVTLLQDAAILQKTYLMGPSKDIVELMSGIDIVVIPSRGEGFPNVLAEAMSCSVPVVTTNVGEIPIILENIQVCYNPGENDLMAVKVMQILVLDPAKLEILKAKLRNRITNRYKLDYVINQYLDIYLKL